jgi:hypothetical protein
MILNFTCLAKHVPQQGLLVAVQALSKVVVLVH